MDLVVLSWATVWPVDVMVRVLAYDTKGTVVYPPTGSRPRWGDEHLAYALLFKVCSYWQLTSNIHVKSKGKGSPYSTAEHRVPELLPVLGSQPAGNLSHKPGGRLPLLSARPAVTLATLLLFSLLGEQRHNGCEQFA